MVWKNIIKEVDWKLWENNANSFEDSFIEFETYIIKLEYIFELRIYILKI